jgi:hypothetical protein
MEALFSQLIVELMPLGLMPHLIIHQRQLHVMKIRVGLDDFIFDVTNMLVILSPMPHPHEFPNLEPTIHLVLLTVLFSGRSELV